MAQSSRQDNESEDKTGSWKIPEVDKKVTEEQKKQIAKDDLKENKASNWKNSKETTQLWT